MITLLEGYIQDSLPHKESFCTHPDLNEKVDENGCIIPYCGNTTVFLLDKGIKDQLIQLQDRLYRAAPDMLADRLKMDTLHMTLHNLVSGPPGTPGLEEEMAQAAWRAEECLALWKQEDPLYMRGTWTFNMCRTSVVLGLAPADEDSWRRLAGMYARLEQVRFLGYDMTPHITLAYYRPGTYDQEHVQQLSSVLEKVELDIKLCMNNLVIQNFTDMNHYVSVL